ncbi:hypothetical protein AVEN_80485-1 [Araneus ventricosus]|uniref:Uncharacterized protein n=1 Tax=Araneus ventricosus TaxID=182803 RepID=A0A4Y2M752_ARAVE|nr:hypothetical protein AVEN_80485-1 [Araneus ventricosus]
MDEFQCSWCSRRFHLKDGHFCSLKGNPDNEYSESDLNELEALAEKLEAATRNQDCTSDDFGYLNPETEGHDTQLNSSLESDRNFSTNRFFRGERVASSPVSPFITQCHGSRLDVSRSDSHVSAQQSIFEATAENPVNSLFIAVETLQADFCRADDNNSNHSENLSSQNDSEWGNLRPVQQMKRKNTSSGVDTNTCRKKEKTSACNSQRKWAYLDAISASTTCIERDGNKGEAQETKNYSKIKSLSAKVTQVDDSSGSEIAINSVAVDSDADAEVVSVAGPSGIHTQSHRTGKEKRFVCDVCEKDFSKQYNLKFISELTPERSPSLVRYVGRDSHESIILSITSGP